MYGFDMLRADPSERSTCEGQLCMSSRRTNAPGMLTVPRHTPCGVAGVGPGGGIGPFFLYSDYYVLVTVYVILGRDPRRWGLK